MEEPTKFSDFKSKTLAKCYEALTSIKLSDLKDEELSALKEVMESIVIRTQSFFRIKNPDNLLAKKMKQNFDIFKSEMEQCMVIKPFLRKLKILWEKFSKLEQHGEKTTEYKTVEEEIPEMLNILKSCRLSKCFEVLAEIKLSRLNLEQIKELEEILNEILLRTHSFMGIMSRNDLRKAKEMKKNFETFMKNVQNFKTLNVPFAEFENAWKTLQMFDPTMKDLEKRRKNKKMVDEVIDEFNKHPRELFIEYEKLDFDPVKEIEEVLDMSKLDISLLPYMPSFIFYAISVINQNFYDESRVWKKKVYIINDNSYPYVVFHTDNNEYFIDSYGNIYLGEMHFLQTFKSLYGAFSLEPLDVCYDNVESFNEKPEELPMEKKKEDFDNVTDIKEISDICVLEDKKCLEMFLEVLERVYHSCAYLQLLKKHEGNEEDLLKILKIIKFHFIFFYDMADWLMESNSNFDIILKKNRFNKETVVITANSCDFPNTFDWLMKNYYHFFNSICTTYNHKTPYIETVKHIMTYFNTAPTDLFFDVYNRYIDKLKKQFNDNIINIFHFIAADVITFLLSRRAIKYFLRPVDLKYILLWVADKYGGLQSDETFLMNHYNEYKSSIEEEYCNLIEATKDADKSSAYRFSTVYVAAYHFAKNYEFIRSTLQKCIDTDEIKKEIRLYPSKMNYQSLKDLTLCANFYFKLLPDILINEENLIQQKNVPVESHAVQSWKVYRKYSIEVVECILAEKYCKQMGYSTFIGCIRVSSETSEDSVISEVENDFDLKCSYSYYVPLTAIPKSSRMMMAY